MNAIQVISQEIAKSVREAEAALQRWHEVRKTFRAEHPELAAELSDELEAYPQEELRIYNEQRAIATKLMDIRDLLRLQAEED